MIAVYGVGDVPSVAGPRDGAVKPRPAQSADSQATDGVEISAEAAAAAARTKLAAQTPGEALRAERIEQAKRNIEEGAYRLQEIVLEVAARIAPYVDS